ncbi:TetR/AcrR family transcriptional regulator, partial [Kineococcus sp. SYSU DK006]|uniref:TetR/AcrR family transcriptional regulator n=1 Tax=Kineococcus sp. SYSU DK006 TaxID=3383127 RepID=UPI003D7E7F92
MEGELVADGSTAASRRPARERLLQAAARRFYADGITATGIDTITAEAGVAKMSLYNNFASKADLVQAYLQARHEEWLRLHASRRGAPPPARGGPPPPVLAVKQPKQQQPPIAWDEG